MSGAGPKFLYPQNMIHLFINELYQSLKWNTRVCSELKFLTGNFDLTSKIQMYWKNIPSQNEEQRTEHFDSFKKKKNTTWTFQIPH